MIIRPSSPGDDDALWAIQEPILRAGDTYALPRDWGREAMHAYWTAPGHEVFVSEDEGQVLGTYYIQPNRMGGGSHVANCGYMTSVHARGRGIARAMCAHSLDRARALGFRAMQFNFVVSSNTRAVALWQGCGFEILARQPGAFLHPTLGYVDALLMYQAL